MEVVIYCRPDSPQGAAIKELLTDKGVGYREEHVGNGNLQGRPGRTEDTEPITVIDGVTVAGLDRIRIEQLIGWQGI
jgi:hypothetical protein